MKTIMPWIGAVLFFALLASNVSAFPLSGGNGAVTATVLGAFQTEVDGFQFTLIDLNSTGALNGVVLVDSEDKFYEPSLGTDGVDYVGNLGKSTRHMWPFEMPDKVDIKRVRIIPVHGDPFSIEWAGVPEVSSGRVSMKFYGINRQPSIVGRYDELDALDVDIKITNKANDTITIDGEAFSIVDQFGFSYGQDKSASVKLLPEESMRVSINFDCVSRISRPMSLVYAPENLSMDISAWA